MIKKGSLLSTVGIGFYKAQNEPDTIYEIFQDEDNGFPCLSVMIWKYMETRDGIKLFETDMFALNPYNDGLADKKVKKLDTKFKIVDDNDKYYGEFGASSVMYEIL